MSYGLNSIPAIFAACTSFLSVDVKNSSPFIISNFPKYLSSNSGIIVFIVPFSSAFLVLY